MTDETPHAAGTDRPWIALAEIAAKGDSAVLAAFVTQLSASEAARGLSHLGDDDLRQVLTTLDPADAANLIEQLSRTQAVDAVELLAPEEAAEILLELPGDSEADILRELDPDEASAVLAAMPSDEAQVVRALQRWDDDVAGGLMSVEVLSIPQDASIDVIIALIRSGADDYRGYHVQYLYAVDTQNRLTGVLPLRDLVLAKHDAIARDLMIRDPIAVEPNTPLAELEDIFDKASFFGLPVVEDGHLIGVVRRSSVAEARGDEANLDHLKSQGIVGGEELRVMALRTRASRRLSWLSINIVLNVVAASVIAAFQETLTQVIALAVFLPIISDMSGCSGNQAVAVSMRELSLGVARPSDVFYVWRKEVSVGLVNGLALGLLLGGLAWLWQGNPWLGLVAGAALALNTVLAVSIGGTVPLILKGFGIDPALASGPVLTTITDLCGFLLVLGLATAMLPYLV